MTINPWDAILITFSRTGALPPCPFCSKDTLTMGNNISCAHTTLYIFCANCGKWTHADGNPENKQ